MPEVSDVDLMELADGTLAGPRRRIVEAELAKHPELQERLEVFRVTGQALAQLFDPVVRAPLPSALLETIRHAAPASASRVVPFAPSKGRVDALGRSSGAPSTRGWALSAGMALAAAVVAVVGVGAAIWSLRSGNGDGFVAAQLALALETTPSARTAGLELPGYGPGVFKADLSFQHVDGRYCRQYELSFESGSGFVGYACGAGNGRWRIEKEAEVTPTKADAPGVIRPAGQNPSAKAIDDAVGSVIRGDALEPDRELALIRRGWQVEGKQ
jgi:hypothetical protein